MTSQPLRTAVLGAGTMGLVCLRALMASPHFIPVAIADTSLAALRNARRLSAEVTVFESTDQLVCSETLDTFEIDVIAIMTPPESHARLACMALEANRHTLCEKPMAVSVAEARRMVDAAHGAPASVAVVGHQLRYNAARQWIRARLFEGLIGEPRHVSVTAHFPGLFDTNWTWWSSLTLGGGLLYEYGSHQIDLLQWWFGPASRAHGATATTVTERPDGNGIVRPVDSDDLSLIHLEWPSGLIADIQLSGLATIPRRDVHIYGTGGSMHLDKDDSITIRRRGSGKEQVLDFRESDASLLGDPNDSYTQPHLRLLNDLAEHARHGSIPPLACGFAEGARVIELINDVRPVSTRDVSP